MPARLDSSGYANNETDLPPNGCYLIYSLFRTKKVIEGNTLREGGIRTILDENEKFNDRSKKIMEKYFSTEEKKLK